MRTSLIFLAAVTRLHIEYLSLFLAFCYLKLNELFLWHLSDHVNLVTSHHSVSSVLNGSTGLKESEPVVVVFTQPRRHAHSVA